jgi:hypothetical protein
MTDIPAERPVARRRDPGVADMATQVHLGWQEPQPEPPPPKPPVDPDPPEEPPPTDAAQEAVHLMMLDSAFLDAGLPQTDADTAAVEEIAKLDPATVRAVAAWVKRGRRPETQAPPTLPK